MNTNKIKNLENREFKIYALKCPVTYVIKYIGVTVSKLSARLSQHIYDAKKGGTYKRNWINSLNSKPLIVLIEICNYKNWEEREKYWINYYNNLTNTREGGTGLILNRTEESRYKSIRAKFKAVVAISKDKTFIKKYNSLKECSEELNIPSPSITWVLRFPTKSAYGYHFVYANKYYDGYEDTVEIADKSNKLNFKLIFENQEVTKEQLAIILGCKVSTVISWVRGDRDVKKSKFLKNKVLNIIKI